MLNPFELFLEDVLGKGGFVHLNLPHVVGDLLAIEIGPVDQRGSAGFGGDVNVNKLRIAIRDDPNRTSQLARRDGIKNRIRDDSADHFRRSHHFEKRELGQLLGLRWVDAPGECVLRFPPEQRHSH